MRSNEQLKRRSIAIAEGFFYSDDECEIAWQPFEDYSRHELKREAKDLAALIYKSMIWAQENY
jgi:hypothetical protein